MYSKSLHKRLRVFSAAVLMVTLLLTARLAWLQIYQYEVYYDRAENNRQRALPIAATRGEIFDTHGQLLASNRTGFAISILDLSSKDAPNVISYLSELLEIEEKELQARIHQQRYRRFAPIRLATDVSVEVVAKIEERRLELPGVLIEKLPIRYYERNSLAAHALGYVGIITEKLLLQMNEDGTYYRGTDYIGREGVERTWEQYLRGEEGTELVETNRLGRRTRVLSREEPVPGNNLYLTIDARLQEISERVLAEVIADLREQGNNQVGKGAVVVLDPNNGAILAMVSYPTYDLNTVLAKDVYPELLGNTVDRPLVNKAIGGAYPVGSTYKMVSAIGALEEGLINERSIVTCAGVKNFFREPKPRRCYNSTVHGSLNVVQALAKSCNIFFYEMGQRLGIDRLTKYGSDFGFGQKTGLIDLLGESAGVLDSKEGRTNRKNPWYPGDVLTAAIGQGHMITPLQLANYGAMLANGGIHYRPHLVRQAVDHAGNVVFEVEPEVLNQIEYSEKTWEVVRKGMEAVTEPGGTGSSMRLLPVKVAGKTGSAQAGLLDSGIFAHSLFVGYAPAAAPQMAIAVIVEHGRLGGQAAVPTANRILAEYYAPAEPTE